MAATSAAHKQFWHDRSLFIHAQIQYKSMYIYYIVLVVNFKYTCIVKIVYIHVIILYWCVEIEINFAKILVHNNLYMPDKENDMIRKIKATSSAKKKTV